jgi:hypothetical protein
MSACLIAVMPQKQKEKTVQRQWRYGEQKECWQMKERNAGEQK